MILTHSILFKNFLSAIFTSSFIGHIISEKQITGDKHLDIAIKIYVPIVTGCLVPLVNQILIPYLKKKLKL